MSFFRRVLLGILILASATYTATELANEAPPLPMSNQLANDVPPGPFLIHKNS